MGREVLVMVSKPRIEVIFPFWRKTRFLLVRKVVPTSVQESRDVDEEEVEEAFVASRIDSTCKTAVALVSIRTSTSDGSRPSFTRSCSHDSTNSVSLRKAAQ